MDKADKLAFIHPCAKCVYSVRPAEASRWELVSDGAYYRCIACQIFGRATSLAVADFAAQIAADYVLKYRVHRSALFE